MADANSDSDDDGVYCELKEYIKQARMNLRKVKKKEASVSKDDQDIDDDQDDKTEMTEGKDELEEQPIEMFVDAEDLEEKDTAIEDSKGLDSEHESDKSTDNDVSIEDPDGKADEDNELEKPNPTDAIESDKEDIATSDDDCEIVKKEHEVQIDEKNTKSDEEQNCDESKVFRSVNELKNCFETNSESLSNIGAFRRFNDLSSDHEDKNLSEANREANEMENNSDIDKQNTDSDGEQNGSNNDSQSLADDEKDLGAVDELANTESLSNIGVFRRFNAPGGDQEDENLTETSENANEMENNSDRDEQNTDSDEEQNGSNHDNQSLADDEKALSSVDDLANNESLSNIGAFRRFNALGSDQEDEILNEAYEETNEYRNNNENHGKQNTDDELQATDDDSSAVDAFNVQYRYALRHTKSMRRSQQPNENTNNENNEIDTTGALRASEITEDSVAYVPNDRISAYNEQLLIAQATIERLYDFIFKDPWEVLNQMLDSKRSSKSSTETDGMMSSPQQIFYTNEESIKEKQDEIELEENAGDTEKIDLRLNTRALTKEAKTYELERFDKNILIIFNQERIVGYKPRLGTRQDVEALTQTFSPYGFDVIEHLDLNRDEIFEELKRLTEMNFTNYGCLAIAVLTHGSDMDGLRAKDRMYYQNDIIKYLKTCENPTLVTKPKVLIIQACRGSDSTYAVTVGRVGKITKDYDDVDEHRTYTLPVEADILIVHSTFAGKTSHRDELNGTWFIQTLCDKINELAPNEDLESIMTEVKRDVAIEKSLEEYNRRTFDFNTNKQIPVIVSTLIRKLYLKKIGDDPEENSKGDVVIDGTHPNSSSRLPNCLCIFDRFEYLKNCMKHFLEDNGDDVTGRSFLDVAETLTEGYEFYAAKEQLSKAMSNHLLTNAKDSDYYKYLYFYKDGS